MMQNKIIMHPPNAKSSTDKPTKSNDNLIEEMDVNQVHKDFYELFTTNPNKDMLKYAYQDSAVYDAVTKSPDYYLFREEVELIEQNKETLSLVLEGIDTVVELGPGSENGLASKTIPLLSYAANLRKYIAVDISQGYLEKIGEYISKHTDVEVNLVQADFIKEKLEDLHEYNPKAILLLGSTLGGFCHSEREMLLSNIFNMMNSNDILILTADTNSDPESLLRAYNDESCITFVSEIFKSYAMLNADFKPCYNQFDVTIEWNSDTKCVDYYFVAAHDTSFYIEQCGHVDLHVGQKFQIVRSHKFDEQEILLYFKNSCSTIVNILRLGNMGLFILKKHWHIKLRKYNNEVVRQTCSAC